MVTSPFVIGIAGGVGSGKTTLAAELITALGAEHVSYLPQNRYRNLCCDFKSNVVNVELPADINVKLWCSNIADLKAGAPIERILNCVKNGQQPATLTESPKKFLLIEGLYVLSEPRLRNLLDLKVYISCSVKLRLARLHSIVQSKYRGPQLTLLRHKALEELQYIYFAQLHSIDNSIVGPSHGYADIILDSDKNSVEELRDVLIAELESRMNISESTTLIIPHESYSILVPSP
jgi:uridine kinase